MLIIWSFVGLKVFGLSGVRDNDPSLATPKRIDSLEVNKKEFELVDIERNPFKTFKRSKKVSNTVKASIKEKVPVIREIIKKPTTNFIWPKIFYYGFVGADEEKGRLAVIKLDNKLVRIRSGKNINNELILKSIHRDSIIILGNGEQKIIRRNR